MSQKELWDLDEEAFALIALMAPPIALASSQKDRLMASVQGVARFAPFQDRLCQILDIGREALQSLLARIDGPWEASPWPGVELLHLPGGPATLGADVGFVRIAPNTPFPYHDHRHETVLILQGGLIDADGSIHHAGETLLRSTPHHFQALPEEYLIYAVVVFDLQF